MNQPEKRGSVTYSTNRGNEVNVLFNKRAGVFYRVIKPRGEAADEQKALLEKSVPKSTRYVTKWSFNIFAQWQNARLNKHAANEEAGFDVGRDKIQSLDTNIVNMTAESLKFWLTEFVKEVCKEDGERYPH